MSAGWFLLGAVVVLFLTGVIRGAVRAERGNIRRDLYLLWDMEYLATGMAELTTTAYSFAAPLLRERKSFVGWLWWRSRTRPDGKVEREHGWALTYRRARKAAGAPVNWRNLGGAEVVVIPSDHGQRAAEDVNDVNSPAT